MKVLSKLTLAACLAASSSAYAANSDPVVLVHGFLGFGPETFAATGFKYWGGLDRKSVV